MKKNKISVVMGEGKLTGKGKLSVTGADGKTTELAANTSSSRPAPGRATCRSHSLTASASGPTATR